MIRKTLKLVLPALALALLPACEDLAARAQSHGATADLAPPVEGTKVMECMTCRKWSARPPSGVNSPPWPAF